MSNLWAAEWHSRNLLDGKRTHIICDEDCLPKLFRTRAACCYWIEANYGYIKVRPDLRDEPHGWRMPVPIKVSLRQERPE